MLKVFASRCSWNNFFKYDPTQTIFVHDIFVTKDNLRYRFINLKTNKTIFNVSLTLEEFKKHSSYGDQTFWSVYNSAVNTEPLFSEETNRIISDFVELTHTDMCPLLELSKNRILPEAIHSMVPEYNSNDGSFMLNYKPTDGCGQIPITIFVPSLQHDFTNFVYQVTKPRKAVPQLEQKDTHIVAVITNILSVIDLDNHNEQSFQPNWKWLFCPIRLDVRETERELEFTVTVSDAASNDSRVYKHMPKNCGEFSMPEKITTNFNIEGVADKIEKVYLKSKCQSVSNREIYLVNGVGEFSIQKTDDIRFGIGYSLFTNVTKYENGIIS